MALRFLRGSHLRLGLTIFALACGVALVCAIDLVNDAVFHAFVEIIDTMAGRAALQVTAGEGGFFAEDTAASVAAVAGVELAVPVVSATAFTTDGSGESLAVHGVDVTNDATVRVYRGHDPDGLQLDDPLTFLNEPNAVILTHAFAGRRGLTVGSAIELDTPTGRQRFTVRALLSPQGIARIHGGSLLVMDLLAAEAAFIAPGFVNRIDVVVKQEADVTQVAEALTAALPPGLRVEAPAQRKTDLHRVVRSIQTVLHMVGMLGLVAAFLIAYNRLSTVFEQRVWQLGVLRAIGLPLRVVWRELGKESLLVGVGGVTFGMPLGIGLGYLLLPLVATTTALASNLITPQAQLAVRASSLVLATAMGLGAALVAAAVPAWRAAQVAIAEVLRLRGVEQASVTTQPMRLFRGASLIAAVAAVAAQAITGAAIWGLAATGALIVTTALLAQPILGFVGATVLPALNHRTGPSGQYALATLSHNPRRAALTVATLGVGLGTVLWLSMVAQSFERSLLDVLPGVYRGDLSVTSAHIASSYVEAPVGEELLRQLEDVDGVNSVVGAQIKQWHDGGGPFMIEAFDARYFSGREFGQGHLIGNQLSGVWDGLIRGDTVIVSANFSLHRGTRVGETITLDSPNGPLTLRVGGIFKSFLSPDGALVMSRELYTRYWNDPQIRRALVRVAPGADLTTVRTTIAASLGSKYGLQVLSLDELIQWFVAQVERAFGAIYIVAGLVMLVVLAGVADTLAAGVFDRTREFGTLRALGVGPRHVWRMVLAEGLVLGLLGLALAAFAGLALGSLWVLATFPALIGWVLEPYVPYWQVLIMGAMCLTVCLVAALAPARRAARLQPAVALRYE